MVYVAPVEALDHEMPWKSKVFADLERLLVDVLRSEVLCDAAVVRVAQLGLVVLVVEEIVHVHIVDVALYAAEVYVIRLLLGALLLFGLRLFTVLVALPFFFGVVLVLVLRVRLQLVCLFEPWMRQDLRDSGALCWVQLDHAAHKIVSLLGQVLRERELSLQYQLVELLEAGRLEGHSPAQHRVQQHPETPHVHEEAFVAFVDDDLGSQIGWRAALLLDDLALLDYLRDSEVADFDALLAVQQYVVELDVSVYYRPTVDVGQAVRDLLEDEFAVTLLEAATLLDQPEQVSTSSVLHDHQQVLAALEDFQEANDVGVLDLLEEVHLLEDFALGEVVLHVTLLNRLDRNILASQFVHAECDLAERTLAYQFDELVEFEGGGWQLIILHYVALDVSD